MNDAKQLINSIRAARLTYCGPPKLENLALAMRDIQVAGVPGDYVEAGVALGGSAILLARLKPAHIGLKLYDVFGMIPSPGDNDGPDAHARYEVIRSGESAGLGEDQYYGYADDLLEKVRSNLGVFGVDLQRDDVALVPGFFEDTLYPTRPVAFAHIDCDWYDSVRLCIDRLMPVLSPGGIIVFDDYNSYSGCRRAVDELRDSRDDLTVVFESRSIALKFVRDKPS